LPKRLKVPAAGALAGAPKLPKLKAEGADAEVDVAELLPPKLKSNPVEAGAEVVVPKPKEGVEEVEPKEKVEEEPEPEPPPKSNEGVVVLPKLNVLEVVELEAGAPNENADPVDAPKAFDEDVPKPKPEPVEAAPKLNGVEAADELAGAPNAEPNEKPPPLDEEDELSPNPKELPVEAPKLKPVEAEEEEAGAPKPPNAEVAGVVEPKRLVEAVEPVEPKPKEDDVSPKPPVEEPKLKPVEAEEEEAGAPKEKEEGAEPVLPKADPVLPNENELPVELPKAEPVLAPNEKEEEGAEEEAPKPPKEKELPVLAAGAPKALLVLAPKALVLPLLPKSNAEPVEVDPKAPKPEAAGAAVVGAPATACPLTSSQCSSSNDLFLNWSREVMECRTMPSAPARGTRLKPLVPTCAVGVAPKPPNEGVLLAPKALDVVEPKALEAAGVPPNALEGVEPNEPNEDVGWLLLLPKLNPVEAEPVLPKPPNDPNPDDCVEAGAPNEGVDEPNALDPNDDDPELAPNPPKLDPVFPPKENEELGAPKLKLMASAIEPRKEGPNFSDEWKEKTGVNRSWIR